MKTKTAFTPTLTINHGVTDIEFYKNAFGATELLRLYNEEGSIHVAGFSIDDALFYLHEETPHSDTFSPDTLKGVTVKIGLMVDDVDQMMARAVAAGAKVLSPVQDYDYGYRQGEIVDPFGHHWVIEKIINPEALKGDIQGRFE